MDEQPFYRVLDDGTTASGAVIASLDVNVMEVANVDVNNPPSGLPNDVAIEGVNDDVAVDDISTNDVLNGSCDVSVNDDEVSVLTNMVNGDSYASRTAGLRETPRRRSVNNRAANEVPDRPRSAFFTPSRSASARYVFDALNLVNITPQEIACMYAETYEW